MQDERLPALDMTENSEVHSPGIVLCTASIEGKADLNATGLMQQLSREAQDLTI